MTEGGTPESFEDPFVVAVRQYILDTLTPLIPMGDKGGAFVFGLLRRALKSASREDLEQVVLHCVAFTDGLRSKGFITEELARQASEYLNPGVMQDAITPTDTYNDTGSSVDWPEVSGQGAVDRTDQEWQEHASQETDSGLSPGHESGDAEGLESPTGVGDRHQAEMAGDDDTYGKVNAEALSEDGPG